MDGGSKANAWKGYPKMSDRTDAQDTQAGEPAGKRRGFLVEIAAIVVGTLAGLGPLAVGLYAVLMEPFRQRTVPRKYNQATGSGGTSEDEYFITTIDSLSNDGVPRRFEVIADKFDGWNYIPNQPIGAIYLSKQPLDNDGKSPQEWEVVAFQTTCPHAGCSVSYEQSDEAFLCPCHNSSFNLDGTKREQEGSHNPSPRPLDRLTVNEAKLADDEIWVEFFDFYTGNKEKVRKA